MLHLSCLAHYLSALNGKKTWHYSHCTWTQDYMLRKSSSVRFMSTYYTVYVQHAAKCSLLLCLWQWLYQFLLYYYYLLHILFNIPHCILMWYMLDIVGLCFKFINAILLCNSFLIPFALNQLYETASSWFSLLGSFNSGYSQGLKFSGSEPF